MSDIENEESQKEETDTDNAEDLINTDDNDTDAIIENEDGDKVDEVIDNKTDEILPTESAELPEVVEDVNEADDKQSEGSPKSRQSPQSSRQSTAIKDSYIEVESLESLPSGCVSLFLSAPTLALFKIIVDDSISARQPLVHIPKEDILADLTARAAVSDFSVLKTQFKAYDGSDIVLAYDPSFKFGENFIWASNTSAAGELIAALTIVTEPCETGERGESQAAESPGQLLLTGNYVPPPPRQWVSLGSDLEIGECQVTRTRPLIRATLNRQRRNFGSSVEFGSKHDFVEVRHYEDTSFSLRVLEQHRSESNAPLLATTATNTSWPYPRNANCQYEPRLFTDEYCARRCNSPTLSASAKVTLPYLVESLQHNEIADYYLDDYLALATGDNIFDNTADHNLREFQTFADQKFGKDKSVTEIAWHPTIKGVIATSMSEKTSFDARIDNWSKTILAKSYIIVWSFLDPILPQLLLEAPSDVLCFKFNATDPHIVAGGCVNGQIVLWDIESHMDDLRNVKARMKSRNVVPIFSFDNDDGPKIPTIRAAAVSHCESSHSSPITDIHWLPDHYEINNLGYSLENLTQKCIQIASTAGDNKIYFWDIRVNKAVTASADKTPIQTAAGVPETFKYLDMKWKPTLRVHVYKSSPGGDYAPTKFSLKEVQGDRHVLDSLEDKENRNDEIVKSGIQKGRTLQAVNTHIFVGTEDGELVYVDWMPQKDSDSGKLQTPKPDHFWNIHDGPITCVTRCPFDRSLVLVVGGWIWSLWKEEVITGPILQSCTSAKPLTNGTWSPTKASVFFLTRADGCVEIWDILDKTHEPTLIQNISSSAALTAISIHNFIKKQLVAIGDINGALHVYEIPQRFRQHSPGELNDTVMYIEREVKRRDFVQRRWNLREQEKIEKEIENKRKAGIAPQVILTEDEIKIRMKSEYDVYCQEEQTFLRELGLKEDDPDS